MERLIFGILQYVVVQFYPWFKLLLFSFVFGYDNDCIIVSLKQLTIFQLPIIHSVCPPNFA